MKQYVVSCLPKISKARGVNVFVCLCKVRHQVGCNKYHHQPLLPCCLGRDVQATQLSLRSEAGGMVGLQQYQRQEPRPRLQAKQGLHQRHRVARERARERERLTTKRMTDPSRNLAGEINWGFGEVTQNRVPMEINLEDLVS